MKKLALILSIILLLFPLPLSASTGVLSLGDKLVKMGFENVKVKDTQSELFVELEDNVYRNNCKGIFEALRTAMDCCEDTVRGISITVLENRVPQIVVEIDSSDVQTYQQGKCNLKQLMECTKVSYGVEKAVKELKNVSTQNSSAWRTNIVLYPQITIANSTYKRIYELTLAAAPAIEIGLWKGAYFTGQVIIPFYNTRSEQNKYVQPGIIALRQEFRMPHNLFGEVNLGFFATHRVGTDLSLKWRTDNGRWTVCGDFGYTGPSLIEHGEWIVGLWNRVNGNIGLEYFEQSCQLQIGLKGIRYIFGDYGVRADVTRHFGEVAIGFYGLYTGGEFNGGFNFTVPINLNKHHARRRVNFRFLPDYYNMEYSAQSGNSYYYKNLGYYYSTRPDDNQTQRCYNPYYIKDYLIRLGASVK